MRKKPCDKAFWISFKFSWCGWDQRLADFHRFLTIETRSCYSCLVLYIHAFTYLRNTFQWNFSLEPSIIASLTFSAGKYILKKAWTQTALLQERFYLRSVFAKKGGILGSASARAVWWIIFENILHQIKIRIILAMKEAWLRKLKRHDTSFTWFSETVPINVLSDSQKNGFQKRWRLITSCKSPKLQVNSRSSRPQVFCNKTVLKNFAKVSMRNWLTEDSVKKRLPHSCFSVNSEQFLRATPL